MDYEVGFRALKGCLSGGETALLAEAATLEGRFRDNERSEGLFGPSETTRSTQARVIYALNQLALAHCGKSFNELCEGAADEPAGGADTQPPPDLEGLRIDPDDPPYGALRDLLTEAYMPEELRRFCLERKAFRPVVGRFGTGHGLDNMIDELFDFCRTRLLWDELLGEVARDRPEQVARFADRLRA